MEAEGNYPPCQQVVVFPLGLMLMIDQNWSLHWLSPLPLALNAIVDCGVAMGFFVIFSSDCLQFLEDGV